MRAFIVEDEENSRKTLENFLTNYCLSVEIVGFATSVSKAHQLITQLHPDLVFLDVNLTDGNCFDLLEILPEIDFNIIFVTSYEQYALKAIRYSAIDYLLKPIDPTELMNAVKKSESRDNFSKLHQKIGILLENKNQISKIAIPSANTIHMIKISQIVRCESDNTYTTIYLQNGKSIVASHPLKEYDGLLTPLNFIRIHQSHLINLAFVDKYLKGEGGYVVMEDGTELEVSRRRKESLLKALLNK